MSRVDNEAEQRKARRAKKKRKERNRLVLLVVLIVIAIFFSRIKTIVELKAENAQLEQKQEELQKERDVLKAKLKNANSKEYIQEQARKQLKMMDPDEILYVFKDGQSDD